MVVFLEFLLNCTKLYLGTENREEGYIQINQNILWFQPFFLLLLLSILNFLIQNSKISFGQMIYSIIKFSLAPFISIYLYHKLMIILGGIGILKDSYRIGMSVLIFPSILHILITLLNFLFKNQIFSYILGISAILLIIWTMIISVLIYARIHTLSIEYSVLAIFFAFGIMTILNSLIKLTL